MKQLLMGDGGLTITPQPTKRTINVHNPPKGTKGSRLKAWPTFAHPEIQPSAPCLSFPKLIQLRSEVSGLASDFSLMVEMKSAEGRILLEPRT